MRIVRWLFGLLFLAALALGVAYYYAGTMEGPAITINQPSVIGQGGTLDVSVDAPGADLITVRIDLEQKGKNIFEMVENAADPQTRITRPLGKKVLPQLESGPATLKVSASRPVLFGLRQVSSESSREIQVRLTPPRVAVVSTHHYVNQGGAEMIVYRVTPPDAESGVRIGDVTYPGFPAKGAGLSDPELRVAFFALLYNQTPDTPMEVVAVDVAGNEARAQFEHRVFPKRFRNSTIPLDDKFLSRVVPSILQSSPDLQVSATDLLPAFLKINNDLRKMNNDTIAAIAKKTAPAILWEGAFQPLGNSQVESSFADFRSYTYGGKDVDRQVHLGFDLAKTANAPISAANNGTVQLARELGIYGNTVILDHGMGVQSLYAHLSSLAVKEGDTVKTGQTLGASGQTGLAGGDHLHFSMMVNGQFVNATDWWDSHWIEDRIMRKLRQ
jgi:murein DD-endopeptidase MepM/ murein hydrolase activator NlpD